MRQRAVLLLEEVTEIKDLGVLYDSLLIFDKPICEKNQQSLHDARHNEEKFYLYFKKVLHNIV